MSTSTYDTRAFSCRIYGSSALQASANTPPTRNTTANTWARHDTSQTCHRTYRWFHLNQTWQHAPVELSCQAHSPGTSQSCIQYTFPARTVAPTGPPIWPPTYQVVMSPITSEKPYRLGKGFLESETLNNSGLTQKWVLLSTVIWLETSCSTVTPRQYDFRTPWPHRHSSTTITCRTLYTSTVLRHNHPHFNTLSVALCDSTTDLLHQCSGATCSGAACSGAACSEASDCPFLAFSWVRVYPRWYGVVP
jgi:hypothetical protein